MCSVRNAEMRPEFSRSPTHLWEKGGVSDMYFPLRLEFILEVEQIFVSRIKADPMIMSKGL